MEQRHFWLIVLWYLFSSSCSINAMFHLAGLHDIVPLFGLNLCAGLLPSVAYYKVQNLLHLHIKAKLLDWGDWFYWFAQWGWFHWFIVRRLVIGSKFLLFGWITIHTWSLSIVILLEMNAFFFKQNKIFERKCWQSVCVVVHWVSVFFFFNFLIFNF